MIGGSKLTSLNQDQTTKLIRLQAWVRGNKVRKDYSDLKASQGSKHVGMPVMSAGGPQDFYNKNVEVRNTSSANSQLRPGSKKRAAYIQVRRQRIRSDSATERGSGDANDGEWGKVHGTVDQG